MCITTFGFTKLDTSSTFFGTKQVFMQRIDLMRYGSQEKPGKAVLKLFQIIFIYMLTFKIA